MPSKGQKAHQRWWWAIVPVWQLDQDAKNLLAKPFLLVLTLYSFNLEVLFIQICCFSKEKNRAAPKALLLSGFWQSPHFTNCQSQEAAMSVIELLQAVDVVHLDFSKAFDSVLPHCSWQLAAYGLDGWMLSNWSKWMHVTDVVWGSSLELGQTCAL